MTEATAPATETLADEATMQELVKLNEQRAATYGLLSRLYRVEVDQPLLDELRSMRFPARRATRTWTRATACWPRT